MTANLSLTDRWCVDTNERAIQSASIGKARDMERRDEQRSRDDAYDASEWGHTILWLCILLLTACVVASGGVVTNPAITNADTPVDPTKTADVQGRFSDGKLTLVM